MADFTPGFRFSAPDALVIAALLGSGGYLASSASVALAALVILPGAVFFCFCNVFRIRRAPELTWAACYLALTAAGLLLPWPTWITLAAGAAVAALLIARETAHPSYHGVGWQRWNPELPTWFERSQRRHPTLLRDQRKAGLSGE